MVAALAVVAMLVGLWAPLYIGRDPASDLPPSRPRTPSPRQVSVYSVDPDSRVLAEVTAIDRHLEGGALLYTERFLFEPYILIARCQGKWLQVQESVTYRSWLRLQSESVGRSLSCGEKRKSALRETASGSTIRIDVIDTQAVQAGWGVLIVRDDDAA